jgi:hypothetical protein
VPDDEAPGGDLGSRPPDDAAAAEAAPAGAPAVTPGGYSYEVVGDEPVPETSPAPTPSPAPTGGAPWWLVAVAAVVPAVVIGAAVWLLVGADDGGGGHADANATSLLNAFTAGTEGVETTRYEGELPPGYPESLPEYDDADVIASVVQVQGDGVGFIAVHDAGRSRDDVAAEMRGFYDSDPWQIDLGQDGRDATVYQFTRIDDPDISGLVLLTESKDGGSTTIITRVQLASGGEDRDDEPFTPVAGRPVPDGFPAELPVFDGAVIIEAAFQTGAEGESFAVTYIVKAEIDDVIDHYRQGVEDAGLTVVDGDPSTSPLEDAQLITFTGEEPGLEGEVAVGVFAEDDGYVQIDVRVGDER